MKRLIFMLVFAAIVLLHLMSCEHDKTPPIKRKYQVNDIIYLKPDSIKALIIAYGCCQFQDEYRVMYFTKDNLMQEPMVTEIQIYGKLK